MQGKPPNGCGGLTYSRINPGSSTLSKTSSQAYRAWYSRAFTSSTISVVGLSCTCIPTSCASFRIPAADDLLEVVTETFDTVEGWVKDIGIGAMSALDEFFEQLKPYILGIKKYAAPTGVLHPAGDVVHRGVLVPSLGARFLGNILHLLGAGDGRRDEKLDGRPRHRARRRGHQHRRG